MTQTKSLSVSARWVAIRSLCVYAFVGGTLERVAATRFVRGKHQHHATCSPYNYNALNLLHRRHWARIHTGNCEQIWLRRIYLLVLLFKDESQFTSHKTIIFKLYAKSYICRMSNVLILGDCYRSILISPHENTHTHTPNLCHHTNHIHYSTLPRCTMQIIIELNNINLPAKPHQTKIWQQIDAINFHKLYIYTSMYCMYMRWRVGRLIRIEHGINCCWQSAGTFSFDCETITY